MPLAPVRRGASPYSSRVFGVAIVAGAMFLAAALALPSLGEHLFWDDEANTAIYARNLLHFHRLTAWDGANLLSYSYGGALGEDLGRELRVPPLPACMAAGGMLVCGETTIGGRLPFVLCGIVSLGLLAVWLRRHLGPRFPWYLPPLLLAISPAYMLYIRNCRYFAAGVLFSLLVWLIWAPGKSRRGSAHGRWFQRPDLLRYAAGVAAVLLLALTHYMNAATLLATLPIFFLDRRYRQPRQYILLGLMWAAGLLYALWVMATLNPLAADYQPAQDWLFAPPPQPERWARFSTNCWWFVRDLGTHEFLPWALISVLLLPLMPWRTIARAFTTTWRWLRYSDAEDAASPATPSRSAQLPATARQRGVFTSDIPLPNEPVAAIAPPVVENHSLRYVRRLAWRGGVLVVLVLAYVSITAGLLPPDMGKGPTAEMRYIVPLLPIGATLAGLALVVLWYRWRPAAPLAALLLLTTNWLYFGFAAQRFDGTSAGWPPTLYRYGVELCNPYETGNRAMVDLLRQLPAGTRVRIWPPFMTYPPMFYVPQLHYCDQLTVKKHIRKDLLAQLPDYLFVERARPDVIFVPAPYLRAAMEEVERRYGRDAYRIVKTLRPYWSYTTKPEIPTHFFWRAEGSWLEYPGMAILLAAGSPLEKEAALAGSATDADSVCNLGQSLLIAQKPELAEICFREALRINPTDAVAHCEWGNLLLVEGKAIRAEEHFRASLRRDSRCVDALVGLGAALESLGRKDEAARQQRAALELRPHWPPAHYNLAKVLAEQGELDRAVDHYLAALDADPNYTYAHVNLGVLLLQSGSVNEAIEHFRAAVRLQPELIEGHVNLGRALASSGQYEAAAAEFHVALSLLPAHSPLLEKVRAMLRKVE